jgi:hypothetical protein
MADNVAITAGTGTTIAADDIGAGVLAQRVKLVWGPDGTGNDADVASGKSLPVQLRSPTGTDLTGTAGTGSAAVLSVQGVASGTALVVSGGAAAGAAPVNPPISVSGVDGSGNKQHIKVATDGTQVVSIKDISNGEYETVAASQTAQVLGATGGTGDYISGLLVIPATTSPGAIALLDGATSITVFTGGASSVSNLVPFFIPLGMISVSGAWKVTTGASVSVIGIGNFT